MYIFLDHTYLCINKIKQISLSHVISVQIYLRLFANASENRLFKKLTIKNRGFIGELTMVWSSDAQELTTEAVVLSG